MFDENFIVLAAFIIFIFLALRYGYKKSTSFLDEQINNIKKILDQAQTSFLSAKERYENEKKIQTQLSDDIIKLMDKTDEQIHQIKQQSVLDLNLLLESKQLIVDSMMDQCRAKIIQDLNNRLSQEIHQVLTELMIHHLDKKTHESINDDAIERLQKMMTTSQNQNNSLDSHQVEKKIIGI